MSKKRTLLEALSDLQHEAWQGWAKYILDGPRTFVDEFRESLTFYKSAIQRWTNQVQTTYDDLIEEDKEKDRVFARRVMKTIIQQASYVESDDTSFHLSFDSGNATEWKKIYKELKDEDNG